VKHKPWGGGQDTALRVSCPRGKPDIIHAGLGRRMEGYNDTSLAPALGRLRSLEFRSSKPVTAT
jgi:hypothetical protein